MRLVGLRSFGCLECVDFRGRVNLGVTFLPLLMPDNS